MLTDHTKYDILYTESEVIIMTRKIKKFDKVIDTPKALAIYNEQECLREKIKELEKAREKHFRKYLDMEGQYSLDTVSDPYAGQGFRGYNYKYPSQEMKAKEDAERHAYYVKHIEPLREQVAALDKRIGELDEALCVALWGFGREYFGIYRNLTVAKKELAKQIAYVEKLQKELKELENK